MGMKLLENGDPFDLYGCWNALAALDQSGNYLGCVPAHDGDFYPESVMDYVSALRQSDCFPVRVDIDVTQACNARCSFCFSRPYQRSGYRGKWIGKEQLNQVIGELGKNGTKTIRFCGGGDPLVHPEIMDLLPIVNANGMRLCVISSLDLMNDRTSEAIFEHVDHLRWSVNAASDDTRIAIHRPGQGANLLSESFKKIGSLIRRSVGQLSGKRRPMIWATFLVLPENVNEMFSAAKHLKEIGVDSISFRPVYHGYGKGWTEDQLKTLRTQTEKVKALDERPGFCVFVPKRQLRDAAALNPNDYFHQCISRRLRTVLEATSSGLAYQSCGMYRGSGAKQGLVLTREQSFEEFWQHTTVQNVPRHAPEECSVCIDVSMNLTLEFILEMLACNKNVAFYRAKLNSNEDPGTARLSSAVRPLIKALSSG